MRRLFAAARLFRARRRTVPQLSCAGQAFQCGEGAAMLLVLLRRVVVLLLLSAGALACAQTAPTPAAQRQQADRMFLLHRGIGRPAQGLGSRAATPRAALHAARQRQAKLTVAAVPSFARAAQPTTARAAQPDTTSASTTVWQPSGPIQLSTPSYGLVTGRVSSLIADPNDTTGNTVYLGATGGGVWKSTNAAGNAGSVTFTPLTDDISVFANSFDSIPSLSIGAISVQPGNPQVLLAGTGDPNDALDSYYGVGILRSSNGGSSWTLIAQSSDLALNGSTNYSMEGVGFAGFAWSTTTANLVVAAASQSLEGLLVNTGFASTAETGLYYSQDAGQTWHLATVEDSSTQIIQSSDPESSPPGNPATAVVWNPQRALFIAAIRFHGYYSSPDGITWTRLANQPGANLTASQCPANPGGTGNSSCPIFRGALAVQPSTGDTFALTTDINNVDQGLFHDVCSTNGTAVSSCASSTITFGTQITDTALDSTGGVIPQADYNLALSAVASQQDTILFAGTEDIYRCSLADSCTWRNTTNDQTCAAAQVAPSTHAIDGTFGANGLLYFGNDGGVWRSTDTVSQTGAVCASTDAAHFQNLNAGIGSLAEISHLDVSPSSASLVLAGIGGFGVTASETAAAQGGTGAWQQLLTGEGSYVAIDPVTPGNWYADSGQGVSIYSCPDGGSCTGSDFGTTPVIGRAQVEDDADYFLDAAPWMLDPLNSQNIILGTCRMWLGPVTGSWTSSNLLSTMLDGDQQSFCDGNAQLRSVGAGGSYNSAQGGEQMYAGTAGLLDGGGSVPGHLFGATVPEGGGTVTWSDLWRNPVTNTSLSSQFNAGGYAISSITVDPHDATGNTLYAGIAGFPYEQSGVLYGSTDGGAQWVNLTNSLPYSPLNSIVVDPGTSSTVYVGGDFGVYYTTSISSCSSGSQNCWSQLGSGLPNAPVTSLRISSIAGSTVLEAGTYGRGIWTIGLSSTAVNAQATLSPTSYTFPGQATGSASSTVATFTLASTGSVPLAIASVAVSPSDYAETNNCGSSLAAGTTCQIKVTFTPTATGSRPGTLTVLANTQSGSLTASLDGTGLTPGALTLTPATLAFPTTATGASSSPSSVSVQNTGGAPVTLGSATIGGTNTTDFTIASGNSCTGSLAANATCTLPVVFNPVQNGPRAATLQLASSIAGSPSTVNLTGNAVSPASLSLSPSSLTFPNTPVSSNSAAQSITVTNSGGVAAELGAPSVSADYTITGNTCGSTLPASGSCSIAIEFSPTATGSQAGLLTVPSTSRPNDVPLTASLSGTGVQAATITLSPTSLSFGSQQQGTTSAAMSLTVTNGGGSAATLGTITASGDFAVATNTCTATLAANSSCTVTVTFTPTATGSRTGALTVPYGNTSAVAALTGTGTAPGLLGFSPSALTFPTTAENTASAALSLTVTNSGGNPAQINSVSAATPFAVTANSCPASLAVNASCTLQLTFTPPGTAAYSGAVTFAGNFSNSPAQVPLSGQGATPPNATLSPAALTFPSTAEGSASAAQSITVTSTGGVPVTLGAASVTANYQISGNTCPASLAPGSNCAVSVLFHPSATGAQPGTFSQPGSMAGSPLTASLNGTGLTPGAITLTPTSLNFGSAIVGTTTATQAVTVANTGGASVTLGTPSTTPADYSITGNTCGATLNGGQTCTLTLAFTPSAAGSRPGQLTVPGSGSASSAVATLEGTGTTPGDLTLSPTSLAFGTVATGSTETDTVTATNSGGTAVHLSAITATGDFSVAPGGTCSTGSAIPASGGSCTVLVTFAPSTTGNRSGTLTLANDGSPAIVQAALAGVGAAPGNLALAPSSLSFGSVVLATASAAQTITATNSGGVPVQLSAAVISGSGYSLQSNTCGASLAAGASCSLQVVFTPAVAGQSSGTLTLPGQYAASPAAVELSGTGVTPGALTFSPNPVSYGSVAVNTTATQTVTVENTGGATVTLGSPSASNGFAVVNHCGASLAPGASCTLQVSFDPGATGAVSGLLTFPASVSGNAPTDPLSGTGVSAGSLSVSPGSLSYPATAVGSTSTAQTAVFSNPGGVSISLNSPTVSNASFIISSNSCGATLAAGATCSVGIAFAPAAAGSRSGTLMLTGGSGSSVTAQVDLSGSGVAPAQFVFAPASLAFGQQADNTTSATQTLTLSNTGGVSTSLGLPVLTGQYKLAANTCGSSLGAGASCSLGVQFAPATSGAQPGTLSIASSTGTPSASAALTGTALALVLSPTSLVFSPSLPVGSTSAAQLIAVQNLGTAAISLTAPSITGDFAIGSSTCGSTLAASSACAVSVTFTPTAGGQRTGVFTISDGAETGTTTLTGTGLAPATDTLSPGALTFGPTVVGSDSAAQSVLLTNSGDATLTQITTAVTGPFLVSSNCGASLGGHLSCPIAVTYAPTALGTQNGTLTVTDVERTQTVALTGQGAAPPQAFVSPSSINFGPYAIAVATPAQSVTITNQGSTPITGMTSAVSAADFTVSSSTCGASLAAGASCQLQVLFTPDIIGNRSATLTVSSPSLASPLVVSLAGSGEDYALSVTGNATDVVTNGQTASYQLSVTPVGDSAGSLTVTCLGVPANSACTANPSTVTLAGGATGSIALSIATGVSTATSSLRAPGGGGAGSSPLPGGPLSKTAIALALLCPLIFVPRRHRRRLLLGCAALVLLSAPIACGVHASGVDGGGGGGTVAGQTPSGSYTITVSAAFPGATRTTTVTLVVQ